MAVRRIVIELAIPEDVYQAIPLAKKVAFRDMVREWKAKAVIINAGSLNEEMTVTAKMHLCFHDEGNNKPCEPEENI